MALESFLQAVLPAKGNFFETHISPSGVVKQTRVDTLGKLVMCINAAIQTRSNVYYATGTYGKTRTAADAKTKKALFLDIDYAEDGSKQYKNKKEVHTALKKAIKKGLPAPSFIVGSGHGYHVYWALTETIDVATWHPLAVALEQACTACDLAYDKGITTDAARIFRVPTSVNYKDPQNPKPCELKVDTSKRYSLEEIQGLLEPYINNDEGDFLDNTHYEIPAGMGVDNDDIASGLSTSTPRLASKMIPACPLFAHTKKTGGEGQAGLLWHKLITVLAYCDDGHEHIHAISHKHDTYTKKKTERRFEQAIQYKLKKPGAGPTRCSKFAEHSNICKSCQWRGSINSPIGLAQRLPNEMPLPFRLGNNCVERIVEDSDPPTWDRVIRYKVENLRVQKSEAGANGQVELQIDGHPIATTMAQFADTKSIHLLLAAHDLILHTTEINQLRALIVSWVEQLRKTRQTTQAPKRMGWSKNGGFSYDGVVYSKDAENRVIQLDTTISNTYTTAGTLEEWTTCADHILQQDRPAVWCAIASAFAAPLITFTGIRGTLLSLISADSGTGKSTALKVAQAVWGNPISAMSSLNDTANAVSHKMGTLNSLPAYWDEVRERREVTQFINVVFRLVQGKDKHRLNASIQQRAVEDWATMLVIASNESLRDHVEQQISNSDAGNARIFEITVPPIPKDGMSEADGRHLFATVEHNYGHPGAVYAKYLGTHRDEIREQVRQIDTALSKALQARKGERFWIVTIATLLVGAKLANKLELCTFDLAAFKQYLVAQFNLSQASCKKYYQTGGTNPVGIVNRFIHDNSEYIIIAKELPKRGRGNIDVLPPRRDPTKIRIATNDNTIRIHRDELTRWYYEKYGAGISNIISKLVALGATLVRGSIDTGTPYATGARISCVDIPIDKKPFRDLYDSSMLNTNNINEDLG